MKKERKKLRTEFAIFITIALIIVMVLSLHGFGDVKNIKQELNYGLDIAGGANVTLEAQDTEKMSSEKLNKTMEQTKAVIEKRVNAMGVSEATVTKEGKNRLRIEMPGVKNGNESIERIGETAQLKLTLADGTQYLTGKDVKNATAELDDKSSGYKIVMSFTKNGQKKFAKATEVAATGNIEPIVKDKNGQTAQADSVVIWLDDEIITAPTVKEKIDSNSCEITQPTGMTENYATETAALIRGGSLPVKLTEISSSIQTATIGKDALNTSIKAGAIGLGMILLFMIIIFGLAGVAADLTLLIYIFSLLWLMKFMGVVLTLPGICGIIVGIGMAVDSNIILFTRIKDEILKGRSKKLAIDEGIKQATETILDSQLTTVIGTIILFYLGSTAVKGFAVTLLMSVVISLIATLLITTNYIRVLSYTKLNADKLFGIKTKVKKPIPFLSRKKLYYCVSIAIIIIGLGIGFGHGWNLGIDITGGTRIEINTQKHIDEKELNEILKNKKLDAQITYGGNNNEIAIIKTKEDLNAKERKTISNNICKELNLKPSKAVVSAEQFSGTMGEEIRNNAILSIILAAIAMLLYIAFRFTKIKYGSAAVIALFHDVLIMCALYGIFQFTINNPFIAVILTIVSYSVNDSIVILDRIRFNTKDSKKEIITNENINLSITQTLNRSVYTSFTTILAIVPLIILGGESVSQFAVPMLIGIIAGTYSSIFIAPPLLSDFSEIERKRIEKKKLEKRLKKKKYNKK